MSTVVRPTGSRLLLVAALALALLVVTGSALVAVLIEPPGDGCGAVAVGGPPSAAAPETIPAFLFPTYRAAGQAYGVPWSVLAAVNKVETDFGRDLSTSSAGAIGWMQFEPSTWAQYAVDADRDGNKDPYDPVDAIFTAARYLRALGAPRDLPAALYGYNHSQQYVTEVLGYAQTFAQGPILTIDSGLPGGTSCISASFQGAGQIVQIARSQIGVGEHPPGSECQPYGPCESWCALFLTWVWRHAGVPIPSDAFSGFIYTWAQQHGRVLRPGATPSPGDAVLYGSRPQTPATSVHVGLVEEVFPDGQITTIEGNGADGRVDHNGPFIPAAAQSAGEPGPIYGYAQPTG
jgi:hypothetical protein